MGLRQSDLYRVLHRPNLFLGGERELVMTTALVCGGVSITSQNLGFAFLALIFWVVALGIFRRMAKADPHMTNIYLRHIRYQNYYPARSTPSRMDP